MGEHSYQRQAKGPVAIQYVDEGLKCVDNIDVTIICGLKSE